MSKNELVGKYELMLIVDGKLSNEAREAINKEVLETITKSGGKVINSHVWLDKHRLTFPIKKCTDGTYYLVNLEIDRLTTAKLHSLLRLNEKILRYVLIRAEAEQPAAVA